MLHISSISFSLDMQNSNVTPHDLLMMYIVSKGNSAHDSGDFTCGQISKTNAKGNSPTDGDLVIEISDDDGDCGNPILIESGDDSDDHANDVIYISDDTDIDTGSTHTKKRKHRHRIPMLPARSPCRNVVNESISILK